MIRLSGAIVPIAVVASSLCCSADGGVAAPLSPVAAAPVLAFVTLSPDSVTLAAGATQQFAVTGTSSAGGPMTVTASFEASGGSITSSGMFAAGTAPGTYRVIATQAGGSLADTSRVTIVAGGAPPPPPSGPPPGSPATADCSAPQPGWIFCDDFELDRLSRYFEVDAAGGRFARVAGVGVGASSGMRSIYATTPQTSSGSLKVAFGRTPSAYFRAVDAGTADYREIYWRVYVKNAPDWTGGGGDKLSRATSLVSSSWAQSMIAHVWSGAPPDQNYLSIDPASGTDAAGTLQTTSYNDFANFRWLGSRRGVTPLFGAGGIGTWHCVEAHVQLNGTDQSNGIFEFWVDGTLESRRADLNWVGSYAQYGINAVFLENYWNAGAPKAQERYLDNFVVSQGRIGC